MSFFNKLIAGHYSSRAKEAYILAFGAHAGQKRKYTHEPYINHPLAVAELVSNVSNDSNLIIAAILHDVVEDTSVTLDDIWNYFGGQVGLLVSHLTDISKPEDGNRATRKAMDRKHTADSSPEAKTIKLADLIDNTKTIVELDPNFAKVYMKEKCLLLNVLTEGDSTLYFKAKHMVNDYYMGEK